MKKLDRWILGLIIGVGGLLPWATGAGVKLYLQARGRPTLPWSAFLAPTAIIVEIPLTLWLASPYLLLAVVARATFRGGHVPFVAGMHPRQRRALVLLSLAGGCIATVATFATIFWEFDELYFITPIPVLYPAIGIVVGWIVGLVAIGAAVLLRKLGLRQPPAA